MEKLLVFHFDDVEFRNLKRAVRSLQIPCAAVPDADYSQTLEALVTDRRNPAVLPCSGGVPDQRLLLICGLTNQRLDALLAALKRAGVHPDYKAILTPSNRKWTVLRLLLELGAEAAAYRTDEP